jgi:hypothetical protein
MTTMNVALCHVIVDDVDQKNVKMINRVLKQVSLIIIVAKSF